MVYESDGTLTSLLTTGYSVPLNEWVHIAAVRSSGVIKLYINGVERASDATI